MPVKSLGWGGTKNGQLLGKAVQAKFEVLLTLDDNLSFQQDLSAYDIAVVVLRSGRNRLDELLPLMPQLLRILPVAPRGKKTIVESAV